MSDAPELLPCPFCGDKVECQQNGFNKLGETTFSEIACNTCDFVGPAANDDHEATAHWNRRDVSQVITKLPRQLDAANAKLALHESENVTRGLLIDELQARVDAAAEQMQRRFTLNDIRPIWKAHGGEWHGPKVEHWTIPEDNFLAFVHALPLHKDQKP